MDGLYTTTKKNELKTVKMINIKNPLHIYMFIMIMII